jgi:hypothetical protein
MILRIIQIPRTGRQRAIGLSRLDRRNARCRRHSMFDEYVSPKGATFVRAFVDRRPALPSEILTGGHIGPRVAHTIEYDARTHHRRASA